MTWNEGNPAVGNQIAADIADIEENLDELRDAINNMANRVIGTDAATDFYAVPTGGIMAWPTNTAPSGWLHCNGDAVSRTDYSELFAVISDDYGNGDGSTTFNLPDLRGEFIRGYDNGRGKDADAASRTDRGDGTTGDNVGTKQANQNKSHTHDTIGNHAHDITVYASGATGGPKPYGGDYTIGGSVVSSGVTAGGGHTHSADGGTDARPMNVSMMYIIKT